MLSTPTPLHRLLDLMGPRHRASPALTIHENGSGPTALRREMVGLFYSLQGLFPDRTARAIQFVSPQGGEGTSTVVRELARTAITEFNESVFVLDLAADDGSAASETITSSSGSSVEVSSGLEGALSLSQQQRLLIRGTPQGWPIVNAAPPDIERHLKELRSRFSLVLIDSPPIGRSPEGLATCREVDGVIMVLRAEHTRSPVALRAREMIERAGGNLVGLVLNRREQHIPQVIYKYL